MNKKEVFRRYIVFILGLFFAGIGVAFTKHGDLGVSPISSVANVMSIKFPVMTLGSWLIVWNCVLIVAQVIIAVVLSVIFFQGRIVGTREGTIISAFLTGLVVKFITKHIRGFVMKAIEL